MHDGILADSDGDSREASVEHQLLPPQVPGHRDLLLIRLAPAAGDTSVFLEEVEERTYVHRFT